MLIFVLPSIAEDSIHTKIEKNTWAKCELLKEEATKTKNNDILLKYYECTYKNINKKENVTEKQINEIKNNSIKSIISLCEDRYEITQNKKYLKKAYKYSKIAVNNKTSDKKVGITPLITAFGIHSLEFFKNLGFYCSQCINKSTYSDYPVFYTLRFAKSKYNAILLLQGVGGNIGYGDEFMYTLKSDDSHHYVRVCDNYTRSLIVTDFINKCNTNHTIIQGKCLEEDINTAKYFVLQFIGVKHLFATYYLGLQFGFNKSSRFFDAEFNEHTEKFTYDQVITPIYKSSSSHWSTDSICCFVNNTGGTYSRLFVNINIPYVAEYNSPVKFVNSLNNKNNYLVPSQKSMKLSLAHKLFIPTQNYLIKLLYYYLVQGVSVKYQWLHGGNGIAPKDSSNTDQWAMIIAENYNDSFFRIKSDHNCVIFFEPLVKDFCYNDNCFVYSNKVNLLECSSNSCGTKESFENKSKNEINKMLVFSLIMIAIISQML